MSKTTSALVALGVVAGLGAAALPLSSYAAPTPINGSGTPLSAPKDVPVQLTIEETLSMYVTNEAGDADFTSPVTLSTTDKENYVSTPIAIKVEAGNKDGYKLTMHGSGSGTDKTSLYNGNSAEIVTGDLTSTTASQWGYKVLKGATGSTLDSAWNSVAAEASAPTIDSLNKSGVQTTKVTFGAHIVKGQESGTYNGQVTFTATATPAA